VLVKAKAAARLSGGALGSSRGVEEAGGKGGGDLNKSGARSSRRGFKEGRNIGSKVREILSAQVYFYPKLGGQLVYLRASLYVSSPLLDVCGLSERCTEQARGLDSCLIFAGRLARLVLDSHKFHLKLLAGEDRKASFALGFRAALDSRLHFLEELSCFFLYYVPSPLPEQRRKIARAIPYASDKSMHILKLLKYFGQGGDISF
jgi:hypothetical protein